MDRPTEPTPLAGDGSPPILPYASRDSDPPPPSRVRKVALSFAAVVVTFPALGCIAVGFTIPISAMTAGPFSWRGCGAGVVLLVLGLLLLRLGILLQRLTQPRNIATEALLEDPTSRSEG